jgi:hypothetical protein
VISHQLPLEVLLSAAYGVFLLGTAAVLEKLAQHSRHRADQYELAGFRYHAGFDRWECPEGNHLHRIHTDPARRLARYRAPAHHCNSCRSKKECTDSDSGREIERQMDLWLRTGLDKFHRGLSLALIALATLLFIVESVRYPTPPALALLLALLTFSVLCAAKLASSLRSTGSPLLQTPSDPAREFRIN